MQNLPPTAASTPTPPLRPVPTKRRFSKGLAGGAAAALLVVTAVAVFLVMRPGGEEKTATTTAQGKFTLGARVDVASQTIDPAGGAITVGTNGGPIAGMTLDVPQGSYENAREFRVSYRSITASTYKDGTPLGPLISVDNGGGYSTSAMTLKIPVTIPAGEYAVAVYYDEKTGEIEPMPLVTEDATSITVLTAHFTDISIMQVVKSLTTAALAAIDVDSGFRPGADDWQFPNTGSYLSYGNCNAMSVTAMWYYITQKVGNKAPQLHGLLDNNGTKPTTPGIWQDDSWGYRYVSVLQTLLYPLENMISPPKAVKYSAVFTAVAFAIKTTHRPQLLWIYGPDPTAADPNNQAAHAILAYQVKDNKIWISDPNTAGDTKRWIELVNGDSFAPYDGSETSDGKGQQYPSIYFIGNSGLVDLTVPAFYWALNPGNRVTDGTIGTGYFPAYTLSLTQKTSGGQEQSVALKDGMTVSTATIDVAIDPGTPQQAWFGYFVDSTRQVDAGGVNIWKKKTISLKPGVNTIGFLYTATPAGGTGPKYVDFKYFTITYGAEVKVTANPPSAAPDKTIAFTASVDNPPKQARWNWDFGDGNKQDDGGVNQSHSYKDEKTYTVKVTLSDTSGTSPAVVGAGQTTVTISKEPDALAVIQGTKYLFVAIGGFAARTTAMEIPTGTLATQSGPVTWSGLNFNCSFTDSFGGWRVTYSGTAAADGKSLKSLTVTTVVDAGGAMTWRWEFANIGNPTIGIDPTYGSAWSVNLQGQAASSTFVSGTLTTADFSAPIGPSSQLPASVTIAFSEKPWSAGAGR